MGYCRGITCIIFWTSNVFTKNINEKINRWNRSDEIALRHREDIVKELNDVTDDLNFIKGRLNGKGS